MPTLSVLMMPGLYKTRNVSADIVGAFTNCVPTDAYRGAGRPEATTASSEWWTSSQPS